VEVTTKLLLPHPNLNRHLQPGDKLLIESVERNRDEEKCIIFFTAADGQHSIESSCVRQFCKGNESDAIDFLTKHNRHPRNIKTYSSQSREFTWFSLSSSKNVEQGHFLPHYIHRHIHQGKRGHNDHGHYVTFTSEIAAIEAVAKAWTRMTVNQQHFLKSVYSIFEVYP